MKYQKLISAALAAAVLSGYCFTVSAAEEIPNVGDKSNGFTVTDVRRSEALDSEVVTFEHDKTGALVMYISNDDTNRAFQISFRTPTHDDTGLTHVFEHSALSGSEKYPSATLALKLMTQTYLTFMNAQTFQNNTNYMMASLSEPQLYNLADYYMDSVFNTLIYKDPSIKEREAWHYELASPEDDLTLSGTVYSEMQGMMSDIYTASYYNFKRTMYPGSPAAHNNGGDPDYIPELTNEDMTSYHTEYYTPSNSVTYLYGDLDYEPFLALFNSYFSEYERDEVQIDLSVSDDAPMYTEMTYDFPAAEESDTSNGSLIHYAFECKGADAADLVALTGMIYTLNASTLPALTDEYLPGANVSCGLDFAGPSPVVMFTAVNVDPDDKDTFITMVDTAIDGLGAMDGELAEALNSQIGLSTVLGLESGSIGVNAAANAAFYRGSTGDPYYWFDVQDLSLDASNYEYDETVAEFMIEGSRRSVTVTVPKAGLLEQQSAERAAKLAEVKSGMSAEEIDAIVTATAEYKSGAAGDESLDAELIGQINCVDTDDLTDERRTFEISDETSESGVRYITSVSGKEAVCQGRIMIDISDLTEEEIKYMALYDALLFSLGTDKHDTAESLSIESMKYFSSVGTDIMTIPDDSADGFTPYLIFKWTGYADKLDETYAIADEVLFGTDLSDTEELAQTLSLFINGTNAMIASNADGVISGYAAAAGTADAAYMEAVSGVSMLEFTNEVLAKLSTDPTAVISALDNVRTKLYDKGGAVVVFAGTAENAAANRAAAEEFFADMPSRDRADVDYNYLKVPFDDTAMAIDASVNYNGIYLPYDMTETEFDGKLDVFTAFILDAYLIPQIRNKHNAYSVSVDTSDGILIVSYRDPVIKETFEEYSGIAEFLRSGTIAQDMVDNCIKSVYSSYIQPHGELTDAYWAADDYMKGRDGAYYAEFLDEVKSTTVADIRGYAGVFDTWYNEGMKFTAGNSGQIAANAGLYETMLGGAAAPEGVTVMIDGTELETPVAPYISNDITMVPMRSIFEALGAEVEWDGGTRTVTARHDGTEIILTIDSTMVMVTSADGSVGMLVADSPSVIVEDRTMIPARIVAESLGCTVEWDEASRTVEIYTPSDN